MDADSNQFLEDEGILEEVEALAVKRLLAHLLRAAMDKEGLSKAAMAARMRTSRSQLDRLLDPANSSVTLATLARAAAVLGQRLHITLRSRKAA